VSDSDAGTAGCLFVGLLVWVLIVILGIRAAKARGRSPHWMWFGLSPLGAVVVWIVMLALPPLKQCSKCLQRNAATAVVCQHCGNSEFLAATATGTPPPVSVSWMLPGGPQEQILRDPSGRLYVSRGGVSVWLPEPVHQTPDGRFYAIRNGVAVPLAADEASRVVRVG
jgi:hypothetical protein